MSADEPPIADVERELDATGLTCPMPLLRTKKVLSSMTSGDRLRVRATDPGSVMDFEAFAERTGNPLLESRSEDGVFVFVLQKG